MSITLSSRRIASTAAWSADFSSPRPTQSAEQTAARSVTRPISSASMRFRLDVFSLISFPITFRSSGIAGLVHGSSLTTLTIFNSDDERRSRHIFMVCKQGPGAGHRAFIRLMRDEDDRHPAAFIALAATLHDAFDRNRRIRQRLGDGGHAARAVNRAKPQIEGALMRIHQRLCGRLQLRRRYDEGRNDGAACNIDHV